MNSFLYDCIECAFPQEYISARYIDYPSDLYIYAMNDHYFTVDVKDKEAHVKLLTIDEYIGLISTICNSGFVGIKDGVISYNKGKTYIRG